MNRFQCIKPNKLSYAQMLRLLRCNNILDTYMNNLFFSNLPILIALFSIFPSKLEWTQYIYCTLKMLLIHNLIVVNGNCTLTNNGGWSIYERCNRCVVSTDDWLIFLWFVCFSFFSFVLSQHIEKIN